MPVPEIPEGDAAMFDFWEQIFQFGGMANGATRTWEKSDQIHSTLWGQKVLA